MNVNKKIILIFIFFSILIVFSQKIYLADIGSVANVNQSFIRVGYFFEKYPYFYKNPSENLATEEKDSESLFLGEEVKLIRDLFGDEIEVIYERVDLNQDLTSYDIIGGGIIKSGYSERIFPDFFSKVYKTDEIFLYRNKKYKDLSFMEILENNLIFGVKLYTLSYYVTEEFSNKLQFAFYPDLFRNLNNGKVAYALLDSNDLLQMNTGKYKNIESSGSVYKEEYVLYFNNIYKKLYTKIDRIIKKTYGEKYD